ncbi:(2Fe-2S)-binding protein [Phytoactinopolyspora sp. XMNu-373]|uniref:(2Fe-2S)-binding protein n=2 Tax=Phytoactinopolyspora mesophila TaxID=2650750 RepID=A0A7K3M4Y7_9ACTN|nr:(2Fe-2S)-binding protein [Phytoactinopolyspora mesophila]
MSNDAGADTELPLPVRLALRAEHAQVLDKIHEPAHSLARALVADQRRHDVLTGKWLGHAAHPVLTDLPLGAWMSSMLLDLLGGRKARVASRRLVAVGVVGAVPTALTGVAEWARTDAEEKRVGFLHAAGNTVALGLYGASWIARRRGRHAGGVSLGLAGGLVSAGAGYLGAHLTLARKVGARHPVFEGDETP